MNRWDREDLISRDMAQKLGELGVSACAYRKSTAASAPRWTGLVVVTEELARCSMALGGIYHMGASYCALDVAESGSEEQKQRILPLALEGKMLFAYGLSEAVGELRPHQCQNPRRAQRGSGHHQRLQALDLGRRHCRLHLCAGA